MNNVLEMYKKMCTQRKHVILPFTRNGEKKEYFIWGDVSKDAVLMLPLENIIFGKLAFDCFGRVEQEMTCNDFSLVYSEDFEEEDATQQIIGAILDENQWVDATYVEVKYENDNEDYMYLVKKGNTLPEGATGKTLYWDVEQNKFLYTDGSKFTVLEEKK